ncbi:MAG: malonyl-ACP O-methyltransferase BioC [Candidatus Competibacteraceae bacterium]|nr:malonyl-ACP O-methyltransferase BioC [Candidatus Competibacteraceae bacterium]
MSTRLSPLSVTAPAVTELDAPAGLAIKQRVRRAFDRAASSYDAAADVQREVCDRLAGYLAGSEMALEPAAVLDAGCGTGYGARWLAERWPRARLVLADFATSMLQAARTLGIDATPVCADIEALPFPDRCFDVYWSSLAWQWNDPDRCLAQARRTLRPGGALAVATLGAANFPELRQAFAEIDGYAHVLTIPSPERLLAACRAGGWRVRVWERQPVRRHYPDLRALLRSVKEVGAREVEQRRPAPLSRSAWRRIGERYERWREPAGLPLTYDAVWLIANC